MDNKNTMISVAADKEKETGKPVYVSWSVLENRYVLTDRMPLVGEWYSSDGIKHGERLSK